MKTKFIIISTILMLTVLSCKNVNETKVVETPKEVVKENFSLEVDVISPNDDDFCLFYTEDGSINYNADKAVWFNVKGKSETQKAIFNLKTEVLPTNIRIDFGIKQDKGDVTIENFKINYFGKSFEAKGSNFLTYFKPNTVLKTDLDQAKGTIRIQKDVNKPFTPAFYPEQALINEIKKITK